MERSFTVGDLVRDLKNIPSNAKLSFDGGLSFSQLHLERAHDDSIIEVVIQFNEIQCDLTDIFRKQNTRIKVAFASVPTSPESVTETTAPSL